jgi:hypothetical protein
MGELPATVGLVGPIVGEVAVEGLPPTAPRGGAKDWENWGRFVPNWDGGMKLRLAGDSP